MWWPGRRWKPRGGVAESLPVPVFRSTRRLRRGAGTATASLVVAGERAPDRRFPGQYADPRRAPLAARLEATPRSVVAVVPNHKERVGRNPAGGSPGQHRNTIDQDALEHLLEEIIAQFSSSARRRHRVAFPTTPLRSGSWPSPSRGIGTLRRLVSTATPSASTRSSTSSSENGTVWLGATRRSTTSPPTFRGGFVSPSERSHRSV